MGITISNLLIATAIGLSAFRAQASARKLDPSSVMIKPAVCRALLVDFTKRNPVSSLQFKSTFDSLQRLGEFQKAYFFEPLFTEAPPALNEPGLITNDSTKNKVVLVSQRLEGIQSHFHMARRAQADNQEIMVRAMTLTGEERIRNFFNDVKELHNTLEENREIIHRRDRGLRFPDWRTNKFLSRLDSTRDDSFEKTRRTILSSLSSVNAQTWFYSSIDYELPKYAIDDIDDRELSVNEVMTRYFLRFAQSPFQSFTDLLGQNIELIAKGANGVVRQRIRQALTPQPVYTDWLLSWNADLEQPELLVFYRSFEKEPKFPDSPQTDNEAREAITGFGPFIPARVQVPVTNK